MENQINTGEQAQMDYQFFDLQNDQLAVKVAHVLKHLRSKKEYHRELTQRRKLNQVFNLKY